MIPLLQAPRVPAPWEPLLLLLVLAVLLALLAYLGWRILGERRRHAPGEEDIPTEPAGYRSLPEAWLVAESEYKRLPLRIELYTDASTTIGRDPQVSTVVLGNIGISRRHAVIVYRAGDFYITDNGSRGGTYVEHPQGQQQERKRLRGDRPHKLADGDIVLFYKFAYRFHSAQERTELEDEIKTAPVPTSS